MFCMSRKITVNKKFKRVKRISFMERISSPLKTLKNGEFSMNHIHNSIRICSQYDIYLHATDLKKNPKSRIRTEN